MAQAAVPWFILHSHVDADHPHEHAHSATDHQADLPAEHRPIDARNDPPSESDTLIVTIAASEHADAWHVHDCGLMALALPVLPHALLGSPASVPLIIGDPPVTVRHAPLATPYRPPILS